MTSTKVALFIARKDLFHDKRLFVMIVTAVILGIGIQVPNVANLDGSTATILDRTVNVMSGHITLSPENGSFLHNISGMIAELEELGWIEGCLPRTYIPAIIQAGDVSTGMDLIGMMPEREHKYSHVDEYIEKGRFLRDIDGEAGAENVTVLGDELAERLEADIGDTINLTLTQDLWSLKVVGIVNIGIGGVDERAIFIHKSRIDVQLDITDAATEILIRTDDPFDLDGRVRELKDMYPGIRVESWKETMSYVEDITDSNDTLKMISQGMTLVGVMVPVAVLMYVNVKTRRREIGILLATGAEPGDIFRIFLFETLLIAAIGTLGGIFLGAGFCMYYNYYPVVNRPNFVVKPLLKLSTFLIPALVIFSATIVAGLYPAVKASRVNPVEAIWKE